MSETLEYLLGKYNFQLNGNPVEIPNVGRLDLIRWIRELDFKSGAEIGVYEGEFSRLICLANPQFKLFGIDPWIEYEDYKELRGQSMDALYKRTVDRMGRFIHKENFVIVRKTSVEALKDFADESLDFVYIDGNHEDPYVTQDIEGWAKKVKPGGIVAGHDYIRVRAMKYAIIDAINKYTKDNGIQLFILGINAMEPRQIRDRVRSWMFLK